ncbi:protein of unknown function DUF1206 [Gloeocapsa sp. PCC 7428]|uniref:DUF1206 domain-containing protein n=1 Tax=Gloeocapsa sp. PCC 7428 TaxID=1173026 RepID=UPI0002A5D8F5|nr:DUF1206 domain-containing protein [Gloeocapsa sp. PCC 7428]AFZ30662.1 protein of unknown function DUF1206 [Gloeocapsa sp. PCC 7428]
MTQPKLPINKIKKTVEQVVASPIVELLARLGYTAKGLVYFVVGFLAAQAAFGIRDKPTDTSGALLAIVSQPLGKFLLGILSVGIVGYVLWRLVQAIFDPEHLGQPMSAKRVIKRLSYAVRALAYAGLALTAVQLILNVDDINRNLIEDRTARLLAQPFGQWLVGLAGFIVISVGFYYLYEAYKGKFQRKFKLHEMTSIEHIWATCIGRFGIASRGVVFCMIGVFLIQAARLSKASKARGLGEVLAILAQQPFGSLILGVAASGLIAYGVHSTLEARYREVANSNTLK